MTKRHKLILGRAVRTADWILKHVVKFRASLKRAKPVENLSDSMERLLAYLPARAGLHGLQLRVVDCALAHEARQISHAIRQLDTLVVALFADDPRALDGWKAAKRLSPPAQSHRKQIRKAA